QCATGCGARQRKSPTGGAANGTPLNDRTPSATAPCNSPLSTLTLSGNALAPLPDTPIPETAAAAITIMPAADGVQPIRAIQPIRSVIPPSIPFTEDPGSTTQS